MTVRQADPRIDRRAFLQSAGAFAASLAFLPPAKATPVTGVKQLSGLFPIGQTPFTPDNKLDLECLAAEVKFCNRGGVRGFVWPQIASGWSTLSEQERKLFSLPAKETRPRW
jgi:hypothetical protein